jgi:hypothetical protein
VLIHIPIHAVLKLLIEGRKVFFVFGRVFKRRHFLVSCKTVRKATIKLRHVCPTAWNNSVTTRRIFIYEDCSKNFGLHGEFSTAVDTCVLLRGHVIRRLLSY